MKGSIIVITFSVVIGIFSLVGYSSCTKTEAGASIDLCSNVTCQNNGTCYQGKCSCPLGYNGDQCENQSNKQYLGFWRVEQEIASSNDQQTVGNKSVYNIEIKEVAGSALKLTIDNLLGNSEIKDVNIVIHQKIGAEVIDSVTVEKEVISVASDFAFSPRYQALKGTTKQIVKGEGSINSNASIISGYFYLTSPHQTLGVLNERIDFTAYFID